MNDGVKILLERMETHPDEFMDFGSKWGKIIHEHKDFLNAEDRQTLTDGLNSLMQQRFTEKILEELVDPKSLNPYLVQPSVTRLAGQIPAFTTSADIQLQAQVAHMKAHLEVLEMEKKAEVKKEHKTIFGKLFNYS